MATPLWVVEFGAEYAIPDEILKRSDLEDLSWHNDIAPSFGITTIGEPLRIWIEHPDVDMREFPEAKRFLVAFDGSDDIVETDDVTEALAALDRLATNARRSTT